MSYRQSSIPPTPSNQPISPQSAFIGAHRQSDLHNGPFRGFSQAAQAQSQALSLGSISTAPHLSYSSHRAYLSAMNQDTSPTEQHLARLSQSTLREPFTPGPQPLRPPARRPFDEVITVQKTPSPNDYRDHYSALVRRHLTRVAQLLGRGRSLRRIARTNTMMMMMMRLRTHQMRLTNAHLAMQRREQRVRNLHLVVLVANLETTAIHQILQAEEAAAAVAFLDVVVLTL
ncbi:hypothetical protein BDV98DRAFT_538069 [Pterulicium gracile]|uniref:Uncharacterized protein n=1 Tax=Pterulicium gracile TaxID=1884261 RepID=A0A5C3Q1R5_9AGAR|nr:hypothetical protein BDV98DRAFT_538069 [Pterula gracilis]